MSILNHFIISICYHPSFLLQECSKYGPVQSCVTHEEPDAVRIFIRFETQESAVRAFRDMNGRFVSVDDLFSLPPSLSTNKSTYLSTYLPSTLPPLSTICSLFHHPYRLINLPIYLSTYLPSTLPPLSTICSLFHHPYRLRTMAVLSYPMDPVVSTRLVFYIYPLSQYELFVMEQNVCT